MPTFQKLTLGGKHHDLNKLTNETIQKNTPFNDVIKLQENSDTDRLYKIDVAAKYKNVDYIIENLKSDDMLYVSRALNKSTWLVTEQEYSNMIEPDNFYTNLFPHMTTQAVNKVLLHIRINLKDESIAEKFYNYYEQLEEKDLALKWLPLCSAAFIEKKFVTEYHRINPKLFKKLFEKTTNIFKIYATVTRKNYLNSRFVKIAINMVNKNTHEYLDIVEDLSFYERPRFGPKHTQLLMKNANERVFNKIDIYHKIIDMKTVAKNLKKDDIKDLLKKWSKNKDLQGWFKYENVKPFISQLPKEEKFDFVKKLFIDKTVDEPLYEEVEYCSTDKEDMAEPMAFNSLLKKTRLCCLTSPSYSVSHSNIYQWYRHAPFPTAFTELKKLIRSESSPDERIAMLKILITSAGKNPNYIHSLLEYFHDRHINEPVKFKLSFVNLLIITTDTFKYEERTWKILDELFHNLEIYTEGSSDHKCLEAVVVYKLLHDQPISEVLKNKFFETNSTLIYLKKKLGSSEMDKIFTYILDGLKLKLESLVLDNKDNFNDTVSNLNNIINLLEDWQKNIEDYPFVVAKIQSLVSLKEINNWDIDLSHFYNKNNKWRRILFNESLQLLLDEKVFMNMLKHDPDAILKYKQQIDKAMKTNEVDLSRILSKLRIYFSQDVAVKWLEVYESKLSTCLTEQTGYKAITRGLCILMNRDKFIKLLKNYIPKSYKVKWSEEDVATINLRKNFAQQMYLVRPQLDLDTLLVFAKGDYLQYILPSLNAICERSTKEECKKYIPKLLEGQTSLQKQGIRTAFAKLDSQEFIEMFQMLWKTTKNTSIRAVIFKLTFKRLCKEKCTSKVKAYWSLLGFLIDNLTAEDDKLVFTLLSKAENVPLLIRGDFCNKSYNFLKTLPPKLNCESLCQKVVIASSKLINDIDEEFVTNILLGYTDDLFVKKHLFIKKKIYLYDNEMIDFLAGYLVQSETKELQITRYEKVIHPFVILCLQNWDKVFKDKNKEHVVRQLFKDLITSIIRETTNAFYKKKYVNPNNVLISIVKDMESKLSASKYYPLITKVKIVIAFCDSYAEVENQIPKVDKEANIDSGDGENNEDEINTLSSKFWTTLCVPFGKKCLHILENDMNVFFVSIASVFKIVLNEFIYSIGISNDGILTIIDAFTEDPNNFTANLLGISLIPNYGSEKKVFNQVNKKFRFHDNLEIQLHFHHK